METQQAPARLTSIDALRGAIMVVMALDHVRDFIHRGAMSFSPTDLMQTTPALFLTRWITHFCAPTFMFTSGLGIFFWWNNKQHKKRIKGELSKFLLTRGLWLVVLELTVMRLAYNFTCAFRYPVLLLVLWVFGICMIVMAALVWLPARVLAGLSIAAIALHNLLDSIQASHFGGAAGIWNVIHQPGLFQIAGEVFIVGYPLLPWIAVMALGFCLGPIFLREAAARRRILLMLGTSAILAFVMLRAINLYGDPVPWSRQASVTYTVLSFLNCTKYPPSLAFLLMTLGPMLLVLARFDRWPVKATNPLVIFGRVPLFYFIAHFYAAHVVTALLALILYGSVAWRFVFNPVPSMGGPPELFPTNFGYDLWVVYVIWAAIIVGLYPACRWFANLKARRRDWWLSYL